MNGVQTEVHRNVRQYTGTRNKKVNYIGRADFNGE